MSTHVRAYQCTLYNCGPAESIDQVIMGFPGFFLNIHKTKKKYATILIYRYILENYCNGPPTCTAQTLKTTPTEKYIICLNL